MNVVVKHHDLVVPYASSSGKQPGTLVFFGDLPAVTLEPVKAGVQCGVAVGAVIEGPRETGTIWTQGTVVYWNNTNGRFTTTATGNKRVGVVVGGEVPSAATRALVLIDR
jgi:predicted RecA/RadA family phage recombinase